MCLFLYFLQKIGKKGGVMSIVEPIRNKKEIKKVEEFLATQSQRNLLLFTLGINSGLRISDMLALNVGDVRKKAYIQLVEKKTGKSKKIPINSKLKSMFARFTYKRDENEPLFLSVYQNRLNRVAAYTIIKVACESNRHRSSCRNTYNAQDFWISSLSKI